MDGWDEPTLFGRSVEAAEIQLLWRQHGGWDVRVKFRRELEDWSSRPAEFYSELTAEEAVQVVWDELYAALLGRSRRA